MKKILFLSLFISFKIFGQTPKIDVVAGTSENTHGIRAVLKNTFQSSSYSAISGLNSSTNSNGYGVRGEHYGGGIGVFGSSSSGSGVYGFSQLGGSSGVYGLAYSPNSNGVRGYSENGYGNGVYGSAESGIGVYGHALNFFSTTGIGGYFSNASSTGYALVTGSGIVGIGVTPNLNTDEKLDLNGRLRIRHGASTAGVWFNNSANSNFFTNGAFHGMISDTQTGIFIGGNWRFWVNNLGNATITGLSGTGNRPVLADANGTLTAASSSQNIYIQASNFHALIGSTNLLRYENSLTFTGVGTVVAPLNLPEGAKINQITTRIKDNLNTGFMIYSLETTNTNSNSASQLSSGGSTIAAMNASPINYASTNNLPVTTLASNYYYITLGAYDNLGNPLTWGSGGAFEVIWVKIDYTY